MRRLLALLALALVGGGLLFQLLSSQQGFVLIAAGHYVIELSLWTALLLLVALYFLLKLLVRCYGMLFLPGKWWRWQAGRKAARMHNRTEQGLMDFFEGNWVGAATNLRRAAPRAVNPLLNYVGAAVATFNGGDRKAAQKLVDVIEQTEESGVLAAELLRVRMLLLDQRFGEALPLVQRLHRQNPTHATVLRLLASTYKGSGNWQKLEQLLPALKKNNVLTEAESAALELETYKALLQQTAPSTSESGTDRLAELQTTWSRRVPRQLREDVSIFAVYIAQLLEHGAVELAEQRLRKRINRHWDIDLVRMYGDIDADAPMQITVAEAWLQDNPDNPDLLFTLGRICARSQLWGKARDYFEKAAAISASSNAYYQLGVLYQQLGDRDRSADCFRLGLELAV